MSSRQQKLSPGDLISAADDQNQLRFFYMCDHNDWACTIAICHDGSVVIDYVRLRVIDYFDKALVVHT
jgi:hypothetical protein